MDTNRGLLSTSSMSAPIDEIRSHIRTAILAMYRDLDEPWYGEIARLRQRHVHAPVITRLSQSFSIKDFTDPNDDVSVQIDVMGENGIWRVGLSYIGPFAMVLRVAGVPGRISEVVTSDATAVEERELLAILFKWGFTLVPREIAEEQVRIRLVNSESDVATVYQALFSDVDVFPWK
jgi:hypothetical protein